MKKFQKHETQSFPSMFRQSDRQKMAQTFIRKQILENDYKKWSKTIFLEWFKNQGKICENYLSKFDQLIDDEEEFVDIEGFARDSILRSLFRIKDSQHRKFILECFQNGNSKFSFQD